MTATEPPALPALPDLPALGAVSRRPPAAGARREWQRATVVEIRSETLRARTLRLRLPLGERHVPGQHYVVRVTADDGSRASRSYSVGSAPESDGHIELTVERLEGGDVSTYLHQDVQVGDDVEVRGPFGGWFIWTGSTPALLIGGGSGVVPLMSMLRYWRMRRLGVPLRMIVSVREPAELLFAGEYACESTVVYTRRAPAGAARPPGRLDAATLAPVLATVMTPDLESAPTAYVCGSAGFAEHASQLLVELGMPADAIRVERFGPS